MKRAHISSTIRKGGATMLIILVIFITGILILTGVLFAMSPGKVEPFLDKNGNFMEGSISEKIRININGVEQGMFIQGKDSMNPVLLYLHGGMPFYFLSKKYPAGLEDYFTVVWWEQRGSGMSYSANIPAESITLEQMISDTREVTDYLRMRFGQDKIYLMGHSGGTFIGIYAAAQMPELYHAYIGVAQMSHQLKSEKLAYEYIVAKYKENGNTKMVRKLESAPVSMTEGTPRSYLSVRDEAMHSLGVGTTRDMNSVITGVFLPSLTCRGYTLMEKVNMWRGKVHSGVSWLWETILVTDLTVQVTELDIPVYFFHGIYDYTVSYNLAKDYFENLKAPLKGFYTFEHSAHSPVFEEPDKMKKILLTDVLTGSNSLTDKK
ncbi:MAG: alpha/beta hydrolase [Bacteroidales bacterium]|nr:alpha/beta hydrolase [Bacteroidales bacterium]